MHAKMVRSPTVAGFERMLLLSEFGISVYSGMPGIFLLSCSPQPAVVAATPKFPFYFDPVS